MKVKIRMNIENIPTDLSYLSKRIGKSRRRMAIE
jgi:hypothetical protein